MTEPGQVSRHALSFFGVVEGAARDRATTADLWSRLSDAAEARGLSGPGLTLQDVNGLRAMSSSIINAERNLARSDASYGIDSSMIARAPWERPPGELDALKVFQVRFAHSVTIDGEPSTEWRSVTFRGELPATVGDLMDELEGDAQVMADNYGQEHVGVSSVSVLRV